MSSSVTVSSAASSAWLPCNAKDPLFYLSMYVVVSGTLTYTVEHTLDNIQDPTVTPTVLTHDTLVAQTASASGAYTNSIRAVRITVTSWTSGSVTLNVVQGVPRWLAALNLDYLPVEGSVQFPYALKFPNWPVNTGYLLASLVTSSTAARTANVVTVTATGHGITTGTTYVGFRFYYPGSPSLAAGWYDSILSISDANTITFSANGTDFGSESINSGAAWLSTTDIVTTVLPGNTLRDGSSVTLVVARDSGVTAAFKNIQLLFDGAIVGVNYATSTPKEIYRASFACVGNNKQFVTQAPSDCVFSTNLYTSAKDITADNIVKIRGSVTVAGDFLVLNHAHLEIVQ